MKFSYAILVAASVAFFACGDDSSSASDDTPAAKSSTSADENKVDDSPKKLGSVKFDCSVTGGVKVVYPTGGETFKMGDRISIIYGSDVKGSGFRFVFKTNEDDMGMDMLDVAGGLENPDGKTCYKQEVVLSDDYAEPSDKAIIRVIPYEKQAKGANSRSFKVKD